MNDFRHSLRLFFFTSATILALSLSPAALAQLDPELAQTKVKNDNGMFVGFGARFGQSYSTDGSNPGMGVLATVEPGFISRRDSWARFELSAEVSGGTMSFTKDDSADTKVDVTTMPTVIAKAGYGWSLGESVFSVVKVGLGPSMATFEADADGFKYSSDGSLSGLAYLASLDAVFPISSMADLVGGLSVTHYSFDVSKVKLKDGGAKIDAPDESLMINMIGAQIGARVTF
jgi:hypothetical protein